jgi:hypothetical protein
MWIDGRTALAGRGRRHAARPHLTDPIGDRRGFGEPQAYRQRSTLWSVHERFVWVRRRWLLILVMLIMVIGLAAALLGHDSNNAYP